MKEPSIRAIRGSVDILKARPSCFGCDPVHRVTSKVAVHISAALALHP